MFPSAEHGDAVQACVTPIVHVCYMNVLHCACASKLQHVQA